MDHNIYPNEEKAFFKALKKYGYIFPESEEELKLSEENISMMDLEIPDKLDDPLEILKVGRIEKVSGFNSFYNVELEENLAQAAREGSNITDDVWEQMEKDRKKEENKNHDKESV
jgi:hypothetical protein